MLSGLRSTYAYWPDKPVLPCAIVRLIESPYGDTMDGGEALYFEIVLLIGKADEFERHARTLDEYLESTGPKSIYTQLDGGPVRVVSRSDLGLHEVNGVPYVGGKLTLHVLD